MKILFISYKFSPDIGGIEVNSEILARNFVKLGAEVRLITTTTKESEVSFPFPVIRNPSFIQLIKEYIWADVVFENNPSLNLSWPLLFVKRPHVVAIRTWIQRVEGKEGVLDKIKLWWVNSADGVIAVSQKIKEFCCPKAVVIGNPYRSEVFFDTHQGLKKPKDFVFLGRLVSDKGCDMAIEVLKKITDSYGGNELFNLTIIGDGSEKEKLTEMIASMQLENQVDFKGMMRGAELRETLSEHKYILIPSRWREPFGNVALEGLACGCLPFVADGGGLVDAVGDAGLVFERNNIQQMFEVVYELITNPEKEGQLRNNASEHLKKHQPEFVAARYFEVINNAIKKK